MFSAVRQSEAVDDLENAAKKAGIAITPQLTAEIDRLAGSYATLKTETDAAAEAQ